MAKKAKSPREAELAKVVTVLSKSERNALKIKAWRSGRSMSSYLRYLVVEDCNLQ